MAVNGINIHYNEYGAGSPILLVAGSGAKSTMWTLHQVPELVAAGYRVITFDNRGMPPSDLCAEDSTIADMVADTAGLIERLGIAPCRIVGFSLGAILTQELLLERPDLFTRAVMMATRGREDAMRSALSVADHDILDFDVVLPPRYFAAIQALQFLSRRTQNDDQRVRDWLEIFEMSQPDPSVNRAQRGLNITGNRLEEYRKIETDCLVIAFQDDVITPPHLCREVADSIPGCRYEKIDGCGHYGSLEEPARVNSLIIDFFREDL
jgi:pimeloyl-ACP methyl ester carboxylesterase